MIYEENIRNKRIKDPLFSSVKKYLEQRLETIERVLGIPERDVNLEKKYPYSKIKQLYEEYIRELEKVRTWDRLNDNHD